MHACMHACMCTYVCILYIKYISIYIYIYIASVGGSVNSMDVIVREQKLLVIGTAAVC